ncbi:hypothetical protein Ari01nite_79860 [Paractinoplanes rishiriensis]|uniref:Uncharacterized protein n=1 Tax=Paractinoplanes rishiriensis TaxID=1050105 RepID=A0A919MUN5_9ACTN|nr:hypothetical protein Ari01nite_79860 [Actinoplanes rishiriensis]
MGQAGVGVAVAQVGQGEQGLAAGVEASPAGSALDTVLADEAGEVVQGSGGQRNRGRVRQRSEAPGWGIGSWSTAVLPGASSYVDTWAAALPVTGYVTMKRLYVDVADGAEVAQAIRGVGSE